MKNVLIVISLCFIIHDCSIQTYPFAINWSHCSELLLCIFQMLTNLLSKIKFNINGACIANTEASNVVILVIALLEYINLFHIPDLQPNHLTSHNVILVILLTTCDKYYNNIVTILFHEILDDVIIISYNIMFLLHPSYNS